MDSARARASAHKFARLMLALVSTSRTVLFAVPDDGAESKAFLIYGRAKPSARRQSTPQRSRSRRRCSRRLRRVSRGGEGMRNISELKDLRSRVVRRIRWKMTGSATARPPSRKSGARKFMAWLQEEMKPRMNTDKHG